MFTYTAKVIDVYDGDTITVLADLGFHTTIKLKLRLFGINTPEVRGPSREAGLVSRDRVNGLVMGKEIIIKTHRDRQEKFGRWLAEIYLPEDLNKSINTLLIEEGLAVPFMTE
jgi:micrococcal nuclease